MNGMNGFGEMNGFANHPALDDVDFGEPKGISMKSFDAFPKTKPTYLQRSRTGSAWTLLLIVASISLLVTETRRWFTGTVTHSFAVEKGVSHTMQMNVDIVVAMQCHDIHINVQDAAGDLILAAEMLHRDPTNWDRWGKLKHVHKLESGADADEYTRGEEEDVHDYIGAARRGKRKFAKTPKVRGQPDACRLWGSIEENKVQGDFHITARGHGYMEFGLHLEHNQFNFSHIINELSFGPFYPSLVNPLDSTRATTDKHFYKFQYYTSIVPTIYTTEPHHLKLSPHSDADPYAAVNPKHTIWTNQYAVTEQSHVVSETSVPGIFVKYDIEPILLLVSEESGGFLALLVRLVNVVSGVLVAGTWCWQFSDWALETWNQKGRERLGFLGTRDEKLV
ncbi:DUF1692-domain-containing protein [Trichodelitschia bisporula]|uniref:Endoplasmic reticulum-Golgi intermediate compartment protein n=1 Tax=Trichodelitschia bisporula TaxID=703511 RepID=A0A6G1HNZ7_9PEZI|nr:DUF1692-domain-containing protein [Trichodelitschia bisporula]